MYLVLIHLREVEMLSQDITDWNSYLTLRIKTYVDASENMEQYHHDIPYMYLLMSLKLQ